MPCCVCAAPDEHFLSCKHAMCEECISRYILTKWKNCEYDISCPLCRIPLPLSCYIRDNEPIINYDTFSFKISDQGEILPLPFSSARWYRTDGRLLRTFSDVRLLPILRICKTTDTPMVPTLQ